MKSLFCMAIGFSLLIAGFSLGCTATRASELLDDTNKIETLTPELARKLAEEFQGAEVEMEFTGLGKHAVSNCLPLNGLKLLNAETAQALALKQANAKGAALPLWHGDRAQSVSARRRIGRLSGSGCCKAHVDLGCTSCGQG